MIKAGVIGAGHLGKIHLHLLKSSNFYDLVGFYDSDRKNAEILNKEKGYRFFETIDELIENCEMVDIVTPTVFHHEIALKAIAKKKHVFIEKPITVTLEEADELLKLSKEKGVLIQVGHIERLNPALIALKSYPIEPKFIEIQRLAPYTTRGTDVPVVLDKMIHDIDILLSLVKSPVKSIKATGLSILTKSLDIAHARIRFENGTVASIMSSRVAKDEVRKVKIFQKNLYTTMDLLLGLTEVYKIIDNKDNNSEAVMTVPLNNSNEEKFIAYEKPDVSKKDPLKMELQNFISSIQGKETPIVSGKDGRDALKVAIEIQEMIIKDLH